MFLQFDELNKAIGSEQEFIFIRLNVLREYLQKELTITNLPFEQNFEVFMCYLKSCQVHMVLFFIN